ncbi:hypothetical protein PHMEG_00010996 [Phytophthora megakarya]|uniref:Uncharacterized protein n=1 Tax=Phytophthora megakarya TaxID=4795 RepID=A0A225WEA9_9STRA|nr:hypothetical protein PHMEG_00010996 [Phytophthora megakarya]
MGMVVVNIGARIVKYSVDPIVDGHGLMTWVGRETVTDSACRERMITRWKPLITNKVLIMLLWRSFP